MSDNLNIFSGKHNVGDDFDNDYADLEDDTPPDYSSTYEDDDEEDEIIPNNPNNIENEDDKEEVFKRTSPPPLISDNETNSENSADEPSSNANPFDGIKNMDDEEASKSDEPLLFQPYRPNKIGEYEGNIQNSPLDLIKSDKTVSDTDNSIWKEDTSDTYAAPKSVFGSKEYCEAQKGRLTGFINDVALMVSNNTHEAKEMVLQQRKEVRKYTNEAQFEKISFAKPTELNRGGKKKFIIFALVCIAVGIFFAVEANSYWVYMNGKTTPMSAAFAWVTVFDDLPVSLSPMDSSVMGMGFLMGAGILGIIGLFVYLDSDQKKLSRVGHEHGNARLGTPKDFKAFKQKFMDNSDNNMLFGKFQGEDLGLSLNNKKVNRSANVLVIGGTGTGKTFKYIKPNILQENCSMIVTDPSGDIFRSFAPYLLSKGYNVYLFNASDFTFSNYYNPLLNVINSEGQISETQVDILVDLYMKNAKAGKEASGGDPFWDKSEKAFMTALIYYTLEEEEDLLVSGFPCAGVEGGKVQGMDGGRCFSTILKLVQEAKVSDDDDVESTLTCRLNDFFRRKKDNKTKLYYDTFLIAPQKTANTILITTAVDLQIFSTKEVDLITRYNKDVPEMNINIDKIATQQSYLFLGIPQSHQAYNFLIAMLYSQLYGRLYELGERKLRGKYHIGYKVGTPVFDYFDSFEQAKDFYETVTEKDIEQTDWINGEHAYNLMYNDKSYKTTIGSDKPLKQLIRDVDDGKMYIWAGDDFAGGDPSLPIHINFLLDEFKNIGEIPNFLTILSTSRKYRIGSHVVIQDIGQLKTMYKDGEHETVMANVDTTIFLGSILKEDKEEIQKILGKTTIRQKSTSSSNSGLSTSYTPTEVDLMSIDEISAINQNGRDDELVIIRDVTPYLCRKLNLTEHKRWSDVKKCEKVNLELLFRNSGKKGEIINKAS